MRRVHSVHSPLTKGTLRLGTEFQRIQPIGKTRLTEFREARLLQRDKQHNRTGHKIEGGSKPGKSAERVKRGMSADVCHGHWVGQFTGFSRRLQ